MIRNIQIPDWIVRGIRPNHRGLKNVFTVFGADTETIAGRPDTFQLFRVSDSHACICRYAGNSLFLSQLLRKLKQLTPVGGHAVVWIHNMDFDFCILMYPRQDVLLNTKADIKIQSLKFNGMFLYGKGHVLDGEFSDGTKVTCLDTFHFFQTSLARLANVFHLDVKKLKRPEGLGSKKFSLTDPIFREYALRDAEIAGKVGNILIQYHEKFDIRLSISAPQFASRVFRHKFIPKGSKIPFPRPWAHDAALSSYHGGRNGCYVKPGVYKNVSEIDITSAYPYAMTQIPNFLNCRYVQSKKVEPGGIYKVNWTRQASYPNLYTADNLLPDKGNGWVTGYELLSARRFGSRFKILRGYKVRSESDYNPLAEYVKVMFAEKEKLDPDDPLYHFYKVGLLNSLYGKFIQSTNRSEADIEFDSEGFKVEKLWIAGGLYNPFIASLITGFTRAYLHSLENQFNALHSSTDSILTQQSVAEIPGLGGLVRKVVSSTCILIRCKLYLLLDSTGKIIKSALHGFWGSPTKLLKMIREGTLEYEITHMNKLRESLNRGLTPMTFVEQTRSLNISPEDFEQLRSQVLELGI